MKNIITMPSYNEQNSDYNSIVETKKNIINYRVQFAKGDVSYIGLCSDEDIKNIRNMFLASTKMCAYSLYDAKRRFFIQTEIEKLIGKFNYEINNYRFFVGVYYDLIKYERMNTLETKEAATKLA